MGKSLSDTGFAMRGWIITRKEAIKCYFQALVYLKKVNFLHGINQCYVNIGSLYYDMNQVKLAESYFSQCLNNYISIKDTVGIGGAYFNMGNCYHSLGEVQKE